MSGRALTHVEEVIDTAGPEELAFILFAAINRLGEVGPSARDVLQKHVDFARSCDEELLTRYDAGWALVCL